MAHYNQNKKISSALRTRNHQAELKEDPLSTTYGLLDQIFKVLDEENISTNQIIPCLATLSKKMKMLLRTLSKNHIILSKKLKATFKTTQMILRNYIQISQKKEQKKCLLGMWVFSAKIYVSQNVL